MLIRDSLAVAWRHALPPPEPPPEPLTPPDASELADALSALAFDLEAGALAAGDVAALTRLTLAADDLLTLAAALAPDPWPYLAARDAVGALPTGADASGPNP